MIGYPSGQDGAILPARATRCIPRTKFHQKPYNKSFIDQVCSVKMAGYWPRSFFCEFMDLDFTQKKNLANIQLSWPHTWSITHSLHLVEGFIQTDVYPKPTDSHLYLPPSSAHPKHVFEAIPYGVATRLQRNCSEQGFLAERTTEYKGYLVNQGYPSKLVDDQFRKASNIPRSDLLKTRARSRRKLFLFVTTFNPNLPDVGRIIRLI